MRPTALALLSLALATGCPAKEEEPPPAPAAPRERPLAQDGTVARGVTSLPDRVKVQVDLGAVRGAIQIYRGEHAAWPPSIDALGLGRLNYPADLAYDASTGQVTSRTYPEF